MFGIEAPIIKLKLHGSDPWTDKGSSGACEKLLKETNEYNSQNLLGQNNWKGK